MWCDVLVNVCVCDTVDITANEAALPLKLLNAKSVHFLSFSHTHAHFSYSQARAHTHTHTHTHTHGQAL